MTTPSSKPMLGRAKCCQKHQISSFEALASHKPCLQGGASVKLGDILVKHLALINLAETAPLVLTAATWQVAVCRARFHGAALGANQEGQR